MARSSATIDVAWPRTRNYETALVCYEGSRRKERFNLWTTFGSDASLETTFRALDARSSSTSTCRSGSHTTSAPRFRIRRDESSSNGPKRKIRLPVPTRMGRLWGSAVQTDAESQKNPCKRDESSSNRGARMENGGPWPSNGDVRMKNSAQ